MSNPTITNKLWQPSAYKQMYHTKLVSGLGNPPKLNLASREATKGTAAVVIESGGWGDMEEGYSSLRVSKEASQKVTEGKSHRRDRTWEVGDAV